jgi:hypothetical protein
MSGRAKTTKGGMSCLDVGGGGGWGVTRGE